jgi:hypothetical protein
MMRRERRQTGTTRAPKQTKIDAMYAWAASVRPGPYPWDRYQQEPRKPSNRALRRNFGAKLDTPKK